jgi:Bacterial transcriptional activator domain
MVTVGRFHQPAQWLLIVRSNACLRARRLGGWGWVEWALGAYTAGAFGAVLGVRWSFGSSGRWRSSLAASRFRWAARSSGRCWLAADQRAGAVSPDRLVDELWGAGSPATAQHAVQVHVSAIRRILAAAGSDTAVRAMAFGYLLDIDPELVDARSFERLIEQAQHALSGDPARVRMLCGDALEWLRGNPLAELQDSELARREADRIDER